MTENPTQAPADQALASSPGLVEDPELWRMFVPASAQDNYSQIARDQAAVRGVDAGQVLREMADQWQQLHERQPLDGYDHLASWARQADPTAGAGPSGLTVLQARALESARRDPYQAVIGDQALVEQAVTAQRVQDEQVAAAGSAPSVDPASGMLPNSGPLPAPTDVTVGDDANREQQQAAAEQSRDAGNTTDSTSPAAPAAPSTDTASTSTTSDSPTTTPPASTTPPTTSGKASKSTNGGATTGDTGSG